MVSSINMLEYIN